MIELEGMIFFAYHGYYEEEQILGSQFIVDVYIKGKTQQAIDYRTIYLLVKHEMERPSKLIEHVGERIIKSFIAQGFADTAEKGVRILIEIRIRKCNPLLGGRVQYSVVEMSKEVSKEDPKKDVNKGRIGLEGMAFFAPIGLQEEDKIIPNEFLAAVYITTDFSTVVKSDDLNDTLNYEAIFWATKIEIEKDAHILEEVAERIAANLKSKHDNIIEITVNLKQKNPPARGIIPQIAVSKTQNHLKDCAKCGKNMMCYNDANCWCKNIRVLPTMKKMLNTLHKGCLCQGCLGKYATI